MMATTRTFRCKTAVTWEKTHVDPKQLIEDWAKTVANEQPDHALRECPLLMPWTALHQPASL
jgi:hypothetical protein